jgi:hypothetical protein
MLVMNLPNFINTVGSDSVIKRSNKIKCLKFKYWKKKKEDIKCEEKKKITLIMY